MRGLIFFVLSLLVLSFVFADSSTEATVIISGCSFEYDDDIVTVAPGYCSSEDAYGLFYCGEDYTHYETLYDYGGCSRGGENFDDPCCPSGMFCNKTTQVCENRIDNCEDMPNEEDCEDIGCIWFDDECIDNKKDLSCDYYDNEEDCVADDWSLGQEGVGSDYCSAGTVDCGGITVVVGSDGCVCEWYEDAEEGHQCQMKLTANLVYNDDSGSFSCSSSYTLGECDSETGTQTVSWFSDITDLDGIFDGIKDIPEECLELLGCTGGADTRFCGEAAVSLPFFSVFSLLVSSFLISLYFLLITYFNY